MGKFGLKIKNYHAAILYEVNNGTRDYISDVTNAMLNNSLFLYYMRDHGLNVYKDESTRDIVCLSFEFGSKSFEEEVKRLNKAIEKATDDKTKERYQKVLDRASERKDKYRPVDRNRLREIIYQDGIDIKYVDKAPKKGTTKETIIHYKYLYRTPAKAKLGQAMFINEKLYEVAIDWLTMGLYKLMPEHNANIVELAAYSPLTTSSIIDKIHIPVEDIVILKDQDSVIKAVADVVKVEDFEIAVGKQVVKKKRCVVVTEESNIKNTLWDGMGLVDIESMPLGSNGMVLLRNHFFKMCGFRTRIQLFFQDWCEKNGKDYESYEIEDIFGYKHKLKDIKVITTDNAIKWKKKFSSIMGGSVNEAYEYWKKRISADGSMFGVVKTDHSSKLGRYQQMSYQMINSLPCNRTDIAQIANTSIKYVERLKEDNDAFEAFLRNNANGVNHYEMLADLYKQNHDFAGSIYFRKERSGIIREYVNKLKTGKIFVNGDNLTVCGNPYALLLYSVGEDWENDPTLNHEDGVIQCYTRRFEDGEYLAAFRSPQNSSNNIAYMHNRYSPEIERYFDFSENIMAVNCIGTTVQARMNGEDFDSDFNFVTNESNIVKCAKDAYLNYNTVVNAIEESALTYDNTTKDYARMDNNMAKSRLGIGWSSNLAQLAQSYRFTELSKDADLIDVGKVKELYDIIVIMSVLAQVIIDSTKRMYSIDAMDEIYRIQSLACMTYVKSELDQNGNIISYKNDLPVFMNYVREVPRTKHGNALPYDVVKKNELKLKRRINEDIVCPMNWLIETFDSAYIKQGSHARTTPTKDFFIKCDGKKNHYKTSKVLKLIEEYDSYTKLHVNDVRDFDTTENLANEYIQMTEYIVDKICAVKLGFVTVNRIVETALGLENNMGVKKEKQGLNKKYTRKLLNMMYRSNKDYFLKSFKSNAV